MGHGPQQGISGLSLPDLCPQQLIARLGRLEWPRRRLGVPQPFVPGCLSGVQGEGPLRLLLHGHPMRLARGRIPVKGLGGGFPKETRKILAVANDALS
jgi:hypothetical protein